MKNKKEIDKIIGKNIAWQRTKNRMSRCELEKTLNVASGFISRVEKGTRGVTLQNLITLSGIFNCGLDELIGREQLRVDKSVKALQEIYEILKNVGFR